MKVGSICTGYGGLEMGLKQVFPQAQLAWVADNDKAASLLLEARYSGVPNLGDIKQVDWSKVEKVDILTAGIPCQPFSDAGKREGHDDDRDLTGAFLEAVDALRPGIVILENVSGFRKRGMGRVLGAFPRWGSMRDGIAYEHPMPGHLTGESASSSLPTPRTTDSNGPGKHGRGGMDLRTAVKMLPTPNTGDGARGGRPGNGHQSGSGLTVVVQSIGENTGRQSDDGNELQAA